MKKRERKKERPPDAKPPQPCSPASVVFKKKNNAKMNPNQTNKAATNQTKLERASISMHTCNFSFHHHHLQ
jgi:hypothetical protein